MAIDSKNLLVAVKAFSRANPIPLDASEVHDSYAAAETYAASAKAYAGQTIKALVNGEYIPYILNGSEAPYTLTRIGVDPEQIETKNYVQVVDALPETAQEQGVIYITTADNKGQIWNGAEWVVVFESIEGLTARVGTLEGEMDVVEKAVEDLDAKFANYAPIDSPVFTGTVTLPADPSGDLEAATKQYVDRLVEGLVSCAPGAVSSSNPLPAEYKAGQTWRVTEAGTYGGHVCEIGDLIIAVADNGETIVVQGNVDGVVVGPDAATDANIAIFDGITGKLIADSTVSIASVTEVTSWVNEHKEVLGTYDVTKDALLEAVAADAQSKADAAQEAAVTAAGTAADQKIATALADYYTKTEVDELLSPVTADVAQNKADIVTITTNLNTKITGAEADQKIADAKAEILEEAATAASTALEARVGEIPADTTVKTYIDNAIGSGGTDAAEAIAVAKQEAIDTAKGYTDGQLVNYYTKTEVDEAIAGIDIPETDLTGYAKETYVDQAEADAVATAKEYTDSALTITEF